VRINLNISGLRIKNRGLRIAHVGCKLKTADSSRKNGAGHEQEHINDHR
jgi:hypothetical protein